MSQFYDMHYKTFERLRGAELETNLYLYSRVWSMSESPSILVAALKRKYCNLPTLVSLLAKRLHHSEDDVKIILFEHDLHKLEPKEDASVGFKINLTEEEIIKNYLLNNKTYELTYSTKSPLLIKWGKADLINWLRSKKIEIPELWEQWIKDVYPILIAHEATTTLEEDKPSSPFIGQDTPEERNKKIRQRLKEIEKEYPDLKTKEKRIEGLMELHPSKYKIVSIMKFSQPPRKNKKR